MNMKNWMMGLGVVAMMSACVTINIYFPAAEAQKAADKIIDEVWQLKDGQKPDAPKAPPEQPTKTQPAESQ